MAPKKDRKKYEKIGTEDIEMDVESGEAESINQTDIVVNVKSPEEKIHEVRLGKESTIKDLKDRIMELTEVQPNRQRLIHFGKMLNQQKDSVKIADIGVKTGDFIHLMPLPKDVSSAPRSTATRTTGNPVSSSNPVVSELGEFGYIDFTDNPSMEDFVNLSSADYYERVELGLWRARVRLLGSLMLFYYFLQGMANISMWMHPEEVDTRYEPGKHPSSFFFSIDLVESLMGITTALAAMKAANSDDSRFSILFVRNCIELCFIHFLSFSVYYKEVLEGKIQLRPQFIYGDGGDSNSNSDDFSEPESQEALVSSVVFSLGINLVIWASILSSATKFHEKLSSLYPLVNEISNPVEEPEIVSQPQQVNQIV